MNKDLNYSDSTHFFALNASMHVDKFTEKCNKHESLRRSHAIKRINDNDYMVVQQMLAM